MMMGSRWVGRCTLLALLGFSAGGCSFLFVNGPPPGHEEMRAFSCTDSRVAPILDLVLASGGLLLVVDPVDDEPGVSDEKQYYQVSGAIQAALFGVSAAVGFPRVNACRAALRDLAGRSAELASAGRSANVSYSAWPVYRPLVLKPGAFAP